MKYYSPLPTSSKLYPTCAFLLSTDHRLTHPIISVRIMLTVLSPLLEASLSVLLTDVISQHEKQQLAQEMLNKYLFSE